jgi:lysophospholipase L1-like esterase
MKRTASKAQNFPVLRAIGALALIIAIWFAFHYSYIFTIRPTPIRTFTFFLVETVLFAVALIAGLFPRVIYNKRKEIILLIVVSLIGFALLEGTLRLLDTKQPLYSRHPYLNYYGTPNYVSSDGLNQHNSLGFRGPEIITPKPQGTYRIALLGGSTTYEIGVKDWHDDWARQLEKELNTKFKTTNIEVINAGLGGWDSWEDLINLQFKVLYLEPDLIVLYEGTNDVHTRLVPPKYYLPDNTGRRQQWASTPFSVFNLRVVQLLTQTDNRFDVDALTYGATDDPGYSDILGMTPMEALKANPPIYFERNLRSMIALAREYDTSVLLSTWAHSNEFPDYAATPHYEFGFAQNNEVVLNLSKSTGAPVYDYAAAMPMDAKYWADGRHVNELGAALKGQLFADYLYNSPIFRKEINAVIS